MPTLKQLKYLCSVAEHLHFGHAAEACFISQSSRSTGIAELEKSLGVKLIERTNKKVHLTRAGIHITEKARAVLAQVDDLIYLAKTAQTPFSMEMHMGIIPTLAPYVLPQVINEIQSQYPDFKLFVREDLSRHLIDQLQRGELDVLLLALPYPAEDVTQHHIFNDELVLAYSKQNQISRKDKLFTSDLRHLDFVLLEDGHCLREHSMDACKIKPHDIYIRYEATSLNTVIQMVANDIGVSILPKMAINMQTLDDANIAVKAFDEENINRAIGLMWRKNSSRAKEFELLASLIKYSIGR